MALRDRRIDKNGPPPDKPKPEPPPAPPKPGPLADGGHLEGCGGSFCRCWERRREDLQRMRGRLLFASEKLDRKMRKDGALVVPVNDPLRYIRGLEPRAKLSPEAERYCETLENELWKWTISWWPDGATKKHGGRQ